MDNEQRHRRERHRDEIRSLPPALRKELDQRIAQRDFNSYVELKRWLQLRGCQIATLAVRRHALRLEGKIEAVRLATEQARAVIEAADGDVAEMNEALMRLVQQHLFTMLVELQGANLSEVNLGTLARTVATLARASVAQQKFAEDMRTHAQAAQRTLAEAEARGLTEVGVAQIKEALMEITK